MQRRLLGTTGIRVSEIAFGTWQLGGLSWRSPDDRGAINLLRAACDRGITVFDVAPSYGQGRSELLLGRAFRSTRDKIFVSGKVGLIEDGTYRGAWSRKRLMASVEDSLRRLKTGYFDLLALHTPPLDVIKAGYALDLLNELKMTGMTKLTGVSLEAQPVEALAALDYGVDCLQIRFNLLFPEAVPALRIASEKGLGVFCNSTLAHGYLSGSYRRYEEIPKTDYPRNPRSHKPRELVEAMLRYAHAFTHAAAEQGLSLPELAIKYVLSHDVGSAIVGHRMQEEVMRNIDAANGRYLSPGVLKSIVKIQQNHHLCASGLRLSD